MKKALGDNHIEMKSNENEENSVIAEIRTINVIYIHVMIKIFLIEYKIILIE